jgi:hypothetical protein
VDIQDNPSRGELPRLLVAADAGVDPHRLIRRCCELTARDHLSVTLLVPSDERPGTGSGGAARAIRLLGWTATLLNAAGFRLEDVVVAGEADREIDHLVRFGDFDALLLCAARGSALPPGLSLAVRSARQQGLTVFDGVPEAGGPASWLRRLFDPLGYRARPGEPAA